MKKTMTAVALLLALAACGGAGPSGTITEKEFEPGATTVKYTGTGIKKKCKSSTTYDCWELELELDGDTDVCVSRETYDRVKVGEFFQS